MVGEVGEAGDGQRDRRDLDHPFLHPVGGQRGEHGEAERRGSEVPLQVLVVRGQRRDQVDAAAREGVVEALRGSEDPDREPADRHGQVDEREPDPPAVPLELHGPDPTAGGGHLPGGGFLDLALARDEEGDEESGQPRGGAGTDGVGDLGEDDQFGVRDLLRHPLRPGGGYEVIPLRRMTSVLASISESLSSIGSSRARRSVRTLRHGPASMKSWTMVGARRGEERGALRAQRKATRAVLRASGSKVGPISTRRSTAAG